MTNDKNGWNAEHAGFLKEYGEMIKKEGPALEEFRTVHALGDAIDAFRRGEMSAARAARCAGMDREAFCIVLRDRGIPVVDYHPAEIDDELQVTRGV